MWNDTWGWRQACAIVAALGVVGIVLQIAVGHIPQGDSYSRKISSGAVLFYSP